MRMRAGIVLALALSSCVSRPVLRAESQMDDGARPGCPDTLPEFFDDIPATESTPPFLSFSPTACLGLGIMEGPAVDRFGNFWTTRVYSPDAPGGLHDPAAQGVGGPTPVVTDAEPTWL